jgi:uncharacterized protein (TIGR03083 family)
MMAGVGALARASTSADVAEYAAAAERFAVAVAWSDLRAPVPTCPGWSVYDLVVHLGNVHAWAATIVETGLAAPEQDDEPRSARAKVVSQWYAAKAEDLYQVLRHVPPDRACWNFAFGAGDAAFWSRRQLHETTIHQVDLDVACGRTVSLAADVAADGVGEVLDVWLHRMHQRGHRAVLDRPLALTAIDTGDTWVLEPVPDGPPAVQHHRGRTSPVPDRVQAPADVLYRMLWHRPVDEQGMRVLGDGKTLQAFLESRLTS